MVITTNPIIIMVMVKKNIISHKAIQSDPPIQPGISRFTKKVFGWRLQGLNWQNVYTKS